MPNGHPIADENAQPSTPVWAIANGHAATVQIQGYAGTVSTAAGQIMTFYWSYALDTVHIWDIPSVSPDHTCLIASQGHAIPQIQALMAHVMAALAVHHSDTGASGA